MNRWLRVALAIQLLFFVAWGGRLMTSHRDVAVVWLATEPVDPRDLLSGNYVALRLRIGTQVATHCNQPMQGRAVYVHLAPVGESVMTAEGAAVISEPTGCATSKPESPQGIWIEGQLDPDGRRIVYGIERMFVGEDNPLRHAQSGTVVAKVAINDQFEPRLLDLIAKQAP